MVNYYNQVTPMVGTTVNRASYSQPTYYSPPANNNYYAPSYQIYPSYTYVPTYQQQGYQQPSAPSVPTQPRQSVPTVTTQKAGTPIIQGMTMSYQKVSDLGTIGDTKTIQMPDGSFRNYTRTGTNTYQYTEVRAADKAIVTAKGDANGAVQVTKVTPSVSAPVSSSLSTRPLVLYEIPNEQKISTSELSIVGDVVQVSKPDGGVVSYVRRSPTQIQYQEHDTHGNITTPWTSIYEEPPAVAPAAKLTPVVTSPPVTPQASDFISAPPIGTKTQIASSSKADKPDFSVLRIKSSSDVSPDGAPAGEEEGKEGAGDESAEEPEEEKQGDEDDGLVPDWIENLANEKIKQVKQPFEGLYNYLVEPETKLPPRESGVVGGGVENPVSPGTEIPSAQQPPIATAEPFSYEKPAYAAEIDSSDIPDVGMPLTNEDVNTVVKDWLDRKYPSKAGSGGDNELLVKYFGAVIPSMSQNDVDLDDLASIAREYERIMNSSGFMSGDLDATRSVVTGFNKDAINKDVPAGALAAFNFGLYTKLHETPGYHDIAEWMEEGGIKSALGNDLIFTYTTGVDEFLKSEEGSAAVGMTFSVAGTVGAFMAAGPVGAIAATNAAPFAVTELFQMLGANPFKTKANLQLQGDYAPDEVKKWSYSFSTAKDMVNAISMTKNTTDPTLNLKRIQDAETALKNTENEYKKTAFYQLASASAVVNGNELVDLRNRLSNLKADYDAEGNFLGNAVHPRQLIATNIPEGVTVTWNGEKSYGDAHDFSYVRGSVTSGMSATMPDGTVLQLDDFTISSYAQDDTNVDVGSLIALKQSYAKGGAKGAEPTTQTLVLNTLPSTKVEINGQTFQRRTENGVDVKKIDVSVPGYYQVKTIQADGTVEEKRVYVGAGQQLSISEPTKTKPAENYEGFIVPLYEGQKIYINGLEANKYLSEDNYLAVPYGAGKYDVRIVNPDGSTAYHNPDEYVSDGKMTALPLTMGEDPKQPYQKQSYSGGGGGGGGSSGGGGGGGSSYQPQPEPETLIIYGPTCKDAELWQDEVQVYPEIDEPYSISPGYHSIKAQRTGFKIWLKTVYCAAGDSITVSPAFEPVDVSGEPTEPIETGFPKRVFINSDPSGALVLVNGSSSGEWTPCYLDLPEGYYTFTIKKSGYDPYDIVCYVGEVIAWNQQAIELATSRGWI